MQPTLEADPDTGPEEIVARHADSEADLLACHAVMRQLRPHLDHPEALLAAVAKQRGQGYRLLALWQRERPVALAGYRLLDNLIHGRFLYVDDLVTDSEARGHGHGARLIAALADLARGQACQRLVLDTALGNLAAHRFYFRAGLQARGFHFSMELQ